MIIYKSVIREILHELEDRAEVMAKLELTPDTYYAYMVGRMTPILKLLVKADDIQIGG